MSKYGLNILPGNINAELSAICCDLISKDLIDKVIDRWNRQIAPTIVAREWHIEHRLEVKLIALLRGVHSLAYNGCLSNSCRAWNQSCSQYHIG